MYQLCEEDLWLPLDGNVDDSDAVDRLLQRFIAIEKGILAVFAGERQKTTLNQDFDQLSIDMNVGLLRGSMVVQYFVQ